MERNEHQIHAAIIMDGNGRWAEARGRVRGMGHKAGVSALRRVIRAAPAVGIGTLTVYAFSSDNWKRPAVEVQGLMRLFEQLLPAEAQKCRAEGVRLNVIGRRDRLGARLCEAIALAEARTADGTALHVRMAIDYSARDAILRAAYLTLLSGSRSFDRAAFAHALGAAYNGDVAAPDVDLLIRTGGERRLSDFLLWESAYAELWFTDRLWPDFDASDLAEAVSAFHRRQRRFGGLPEPVAEESSIAA